MPVRVSPVKRATVDGVGALLTGLRVLPPLQELLKHAEEQAARERAMVDEVVARIAEENAAGAPMDREHTGVQLHAYCASAAMPCTRPACALCCCMPACLQQHVRISDVARRRCLHLLRVCVHVLGSGADAARRVRYAQRPACARPRCWRRRPSSRSSWSSKKLPGWRAKHGTGQRSRSGWTTGPWCVRVPACVCAPCVQTAVRVCKPRCAHAYQSASFRATMHEHGCACVHGGKQKHLDYMRTCMHACVVVCACSQKCMLGSKCARFCAYGRAFLACHARRWCRDALVRVGRSHCCDGCPQSNCVHPKPTGCPRTVASPCSEPMRVCVCARAWRCLQVREREAEEAARKAERKAEADRMYEKVRRHRQPHVARRVLLCRARMGPP